MNTTELLHRISKLRTSRDDFPDETYCKEHERILTARIEESNNMLDKIVNVIHIMSKEEDFIVAITRE